MTRFTEACCVGACFGLAFGAMVALGIEAALEDGFQAVKNCARSLSHG